MRDHHHAHPLPGDEPLQPGQPVQVEIVRGLVEQQDVEPRQQQRRQPDAGGLSARQAGHRHGRIDRQTQLGQHRSGALLQVGAAESQPPLQGHRIGVVGTCLAGRQRGGRRFQCGVGGGDPGPPGEVAGHRLTGRALDLLRQVPDGRVGRAERHPAGLRYLQTGEQPQQGRLPGAVHPHPDRRRRPVPPPDRDPRTASCRRGRRRGRGPAGLHSLRDDASSTRFRLPSPAGQ